jgi:uncharacterized membrane protein
MTYKLYHLSSPSERAPDRAIGCLIGAVIGCLIETVIGCLIEAVILAVIFAHIIP